MSKFNLNKFNIKSGFDSEDVSFTMDCSERYQATITFSLNTLFTAEGSEKVQSDVIASNAIPFTQSLSETFDVNALLDAHVVVELESSERLDILTDIIKNSKFELNLSEEINYKLAIGNNIKFDIETTENLDMTVIVCKDLITNDLFISESLQTAFRTSLLNLETLTINVRLEPNQTLELDSDLFSAYIGNLNVLDMYNGDWILIDRDTISLDIGAGAGSKLEGVLVFRERYL